MSTTTTTTATELTNRAHRSPPTTKSREPDPVLDASRLADSKVPDGGYGWAVVFGCSVMLWWSIGTTYSWGVMQEALVEEGLSTPAVLSFIGGLDAALISALAILNSRFIRRVGARTVGMLGVGLMGVSEILSGFAVNNLGALFFTSGVLMGLGMR